MSFSDVHPGDSINAINVQQLIDALKGTAGKGVPLTVSAVNDSARYALTLENTEATNSRALNVLKNDGSVLIRADATGVTLGQPLNLPTGSITSGAIADGTIATADLANAAVTNAKLGTDTARLNLLTNGSFEIWQRGNGPFTANGAYSADRWYVSLTGSDTLSVSRDTTNVDSANGSGTAAACTYSLSGGTGTGLVQTLKRTDGCQITNRTITFSARVRTSTANAVRVAFFDGSTFTYSAYHSGGGAYETLALTLAVGTTDIYAMIRFSASCTAYVDNAMLVVGSVPADYAPLHPADDLARCLRYYEVIGPVGGVFIVSGISPSGGPTAYSYWPYQVRKSVAPTVTLAGTWTLSNTASNPVNNGSDDRGFALRLVAAAAGAFYAQSNSPPAVVIEANP